MCLRKTQGPKNKIWAKHKICELALVILFEVLPVFNVYSIFLALTKGVIILQMKIRLDRENYRNFCQPVNLQ